MISTRRPGRLHVITDTVLQSRFSHEELAELAARGGADAIQYREKRGVGGDVQRSTVRRMLEAIEGTDARLIIDDRVQLALDAGAHGVHLGRDDESAERARLRLGPRMWIGGTANSLDEALRVATTPVDYLGVGPVFGTSSKAAAAPRMGLETLGKIVVQAGKPVVAIGGITVDRMEALLAVGVWGIAVLSAVVCAEDPRRATQAFRQALEMSAQTERVG